MKKFIAYLLLIVVCVLILALSVRGMPGNIDLNNMDTNKWINSGPFELSPERGRFALTYSIVENKTVFFNLPTARFATPDLGFKNGNFVSLFAPAVSYLVIPGFLLGKMFGYSQVGTFSVISLFALLNFLLIVYIAVKLGAHHIAAVLGGLSFLFASPAFTYGATLYQHHISTFLILLSIFILMKFKSLWSLFLIWILCGASLTVDYPNLFLMFPIGLFALGRMFVIGKDNEKYLFKIKYLGFITFISLLIPLAFFLWFNKMSYGNPLQLSGTIPGVREIDKDGKPVAPRDADVKPENLEKYFNPELQHKSATGFFLTRNILNGLYIHILSPDRGVIMYTPVILLGLIGAYLLIKEKNPYFPLIVSIICIDILLYSMWGDPWGGWAFGSRYLIPSYALMAIFIGIFLNKYKNNIILFLMFIILFAYSAFVNTSGVLTSSMNPPEVEVLRLEKISGKIQPYTYERNVEIIFGNYSKSFIYQVFAKNYVSAWQYFQIVYGLILLLAVIPFVNLYFIKDENRKISRRSALSRSRRFVKVFVNKSKFKLNNLRSNILQKFTRFKK